MPVVGAIIQCTNGSTKDVTPPNDIVVNRAEWGDVVRMRTSLRTIDPLILEVAGLQAGHEILFINCDDPKVKALVKAGALDKLPKDAVKPYALPNTDLTGLQNIELSDKAAADLGLTRGCEFAMLQRDRAGNLSATPTFVELANAGDTVQMWGRPAGAHVGDVAIATPTYQWNNRSYVQDSNEYNFVRGRDATPAFTYLQDIQLFLDAKTGTVSLTADHAVTGKSTIRLKNLSNQKTYEGKDTEGNGSIKLDGIELKPGDRYTVCVIDRNGVQEKVVDAEFMPVACGGGCSPLELQLQGK
jgi:hypothetical protein